jgi:peptidoglycan/LPS O-acetylase OafA/YrhL
MTFGFSTFLDITRFLAAVVVLLSHFGAEEITHSIFYTFDFISHSAVLTFFVLSGYVIAYVTEKKERTLFAYTLSRFCRIYSVVVPAIILTIAVDLWGRSINPQFYREYTYFDTSAGLIQVFSSLFFVAQNWSYNFSPFSDGSFWSLNYEVWYYVGFAILLWTPVAWLRYLLLIGSALFVGPKIVLLSPVWFFGVAVRRLEQRLTMPRRFCQITFTVSTLTVLLWDGLERAHPWFPRIEAPDFRMFGSTFTIPLRDYATGLLISIAFLTAARLLRDWRPSRSMHGVIKWCADMTFSVYLFHRPLLLFLAAALPGSIEDNRKRTAVLVITVISIVILSYVSERQKDRLKSWVLALCTTLKWRPAQSTTVQAVAESALQLENLGPRPE